MNLDKRIAPKAIYPHIAHLNATEVMEICEFYEQVECAPGQGRNLEEDAKWHTGGLIQKLATLRTFIRSTYVNTLHCGQCGRLYAPTNYDLASDGIPWDEPCDECGAKEKTRLWILPAAVGNAKPIGQATK